MRTLAPLAGLALLSATCGTKPEGPADQEAERPKPAVQGWKDVAGGRMNPDGTFFSEAGRFVAVFPGEPVHESKEVETEVGKVRMEVFVHEESVTMAYMIAYTDYPTKYVTELGWQALLDRAVAGAIRALGIEQVDAQEHVEVNGFHGVKYRAHGEGPHIVSQILLVGGRMFQITLLSDGIYPIDAVCDQFINGFHMILPGQQQQEWWPEDFPVPEDSIRARLE